MSEEFYARLVISSHTITPKRIDSLLGITSDEFYLEGDLRKNTKISQKENAWIIYSRTSRSSQIEVHIADLLERVSPIIDKIRTITEHPDVEVEFCCVIFTTERPALFFSKEQVSTLCSMGASIDIDLYFLPTEDG